MKTPLDPESPLRRLDAAGVRFIVVGGFAVNAHGYIRPSVDLDIVPAPDRANLGRPATPPRELRAVPVGVGEGDLAVDEFPYDATTRTISLKARISSRGRPRRPRHHAVAARDRERERV